MKSLTQNIIGLFLTIILVNGLGAASDSDPLPSSIKTAPLSVNQVVDNLIRKDEERAKALRQYQSTRIYRLSYHGFPGDRGAQMTVEATYDRPSTKNFKVISQSGSKLIIDRVFKRLLDISVSSLLLLLLAPMFPGGVSIRNERAVEKDTCSILGFLSSPATGLDI